MTLSKSKISWCDAGWTTVRGCTKVSPGCDNCYAERITARFHPDDPAIKDGHWSGHVETLPANLTDPIRAKRGRVIFVNPMADTFHPAVPFEFIAAMFGVMAATPQHRYLVLTKRAVRMKEFFDWLAHREKQGAQVFPADDTGWLMRQLGSHEANKHGVYIENHGGPWPLPNVWLGVTAEDQTRADERIPALLQCPAAGYFVSVEPMLGPINICAVPEGRPAEFSARYSPLGDLDWVICGGESGPGARPMYPDWARSLRDQCVKAGVPFYFKQWGEWKISTKEEPMRVGKHEAGHLLDGREWFEHPFRGDDNKPFGAQKRHGAW
jgi:protein gp37